MYRLLIVDDEPAIAEGLAEMLSTSELPLSEIRFFFSARHAMQVFEEAPFDLVLADIRMPEMDGLALTRQLKERAPHTGIVFLTGFSDFEYARQAIQLGASNYLLKPAEDEEVIDALRNAIGELERRYDLLVSIEASRRIASKALPLLQEDVFRRLLREKLDPPLLDRLFDERRIPLSSELPVWTLLMRIDDIGRRFLPQDEELVHYAVRNLMTELWSDYFHLASFRNEDFQVVLLQIKSAEEETPHAGPLKQLAERLGDAQETVQRVLGVTLSLLLTPAPSVWREWPDALRYAENELRLRAFRSTLLVPPARERASYQTVNVLLGKLTEAIQKRDAALFQAVLDEAFPAGEGKGLHAAAGQEQMAIQYIAVSNQLSQLMLLYNLQPFLDPPTTEKLGNLKAHRDLGAMKRFLVDIFHLITERMAAVRGNPSEILIEQTKVYIHDHLHEDLSLSKLAKLKFVSASYLSRLFHQLTGEQLLSYITRIKMEEAKKLLADERLRVQDVADRLGYQSANYFSKVFRKSVGISPQDFRSSLMQ